VAVGPAIIAASPLRNILLHWQMPPGWGVDTQQASLTWTGSQSLSNITITDPTGMRLAKIESLSLDRSLLGLCWQRDDLGKMLIVRPDLQVALRPEGSSNLEDFLTALAEHYASPESPSTETPTLDLEIIGGSVRAVDAEQNPLWNLEQLNLVGNLADSSTDLAINGTAQLTQSGQEKPGQLKFRLQTLDDGQQRLNLLAEELPLKPFEAALARMLPGSEIAGTLSLDAEARWDWQSQEEFQLTTLGRLEAQSFHLMADRLQGDHVHFDRLSVPWKLASTGDQITVEQLALESDWAELQATGALKLQELLPLTRSSLPKRALNLEGTVELAPLAKMLPNTLRLREGVSVDSGKLALNLSSSAEETGFRWQVSSSVVNLAGQDRGRVIRWEQPVELAAEWMDSPMGPRLEQVSLKSPFATADFTTNQQEIRGSFQADLGQFSQELGQFIDVQSWQCRGSATGNLVFSQEEDQQFEGDANIELRELTIAHQNRTIWEESLLNVDLHAAGKAEELVPQSLSAGTLNLRGARDTMQLRLLEAVDLSAGSPWTVQVQGRGPLESWAARLRPWVTRVPADVQGDAYVQGMVFVDSSTIQMSELNGSVAQLLVREGNVAIDEPRVEFAGDCLWDSQANRLHSNQLQWIGSTISFRSRNLQIAFTPDEVPEATGEIAFSSNLERLSAAAGWMGTPGATWPRGTVTGRCDLQSTPQQLQANFSLESEHLQLMRNAMGTGAAYGDPTILWSEPKLSTTGKLYYTNAQDTAAIEHLQVTGETMQLDCSAQWENFSASGPVEIRGSLDYDPATLATLVSTYAGPDVMVQGDRRVQFEARGRLAGNESSPVDEHWSQHWRATAQTGWTSARLFGLSVSAGTLEATVAEGHVVTSPLEIAIGNGSVTAGPRVVLDPPPQRLVLPAGPLFRNVRISPEVSETMLKYVAPVLAGATRVDGLFSLELNETSVPLSDPKQTRTEGNLSVHQLTVSPSPMVRDLATLIKRLESIKEPQNLLRSSRSPQDSKLLSIKDQQIAFQVAEGRVHQRNLEFVVDNVPVRSNGSVGFDQTLALVIEIPIQDKWIEKEPALRGLAGQTLRIPIQGTFQNPRIDERAVANLSQQLLEGAARGFLGNEIDRQLEKLFPKN